MKYVLDLPKGLTQQEILSHLKEVPRETQQLQVSGSGSSIGEEGVLYIVENLTGLTSLDLRNNGIGDKGAAHIAKGLASLRFLDLRNNRIGDDGVAHIAKSLTGLTSLGLRTNDIGDDGAAHIAKGLTSLTSLDLSFNEIGADGVTHIAKSMTGLTSLGLSINNIGADSAAHIAKGLTCLTSLALRYNKIGDNGAAHIAKDLTGLISLDLKSSNIGDKGAARIAKGLTALRFLDLSTNNIGTNGAAHIAKGLTSLTSLDLSSNDIGADGAAHIAKGLTSLTWLDLRNNTKGIPSNCLTDINALREYFKVRQVEHLVPNTRIRAMLIGEAEVGKTTLFKALTGTPFTLGQEYRTQGLDRARLTFNQIKTRDFDTLDLELDLWDMGGQSLQQMMHGFFFRSDAIYLLVINEQSSFENMRLWLNQLKYQPSDQNIGKLSVIPVRNPTKNAKTKISGMLIDQLKSEFSADFDWGTTVTVDLTDAQNPDVERLITCLNWSLEAYRIQEYWESIDDIAASIEEWPEPYLNRSGFLDRLLNDTVFTEAFERIGAKLREENPNEVFEKRGFAATVTALLDHKGIITDLKDPEFIILDPLWVEKGLYSLLPPEDGALPEEHSAQVFLKKLSHIDEGAQLPGIFTLPDIQPLWDDQGYSTTEQDALLDILCKKELGLVINLKSSAETRYFVPAYLDHVQEKSDADLIAAIGAAYQEALFCVVYEKTYWPPYFIYHHMVRCGADAKHKEDHELGFELFDHGKTLSKQHYKIQSPNIPELNIEIIFFQGKLWCFGRAKNSQYLNTLQEHFKLLKDDLYAIQPQNLSRENRDIAGLIPCPGCMEYHIEQAQQKTFEKVNFYPNREVYNNQHSGVPISCSGNAPGQHVRPAAQILNHLKAMNYDKPHSLENSVINISLFLYFSGLALKEPPSQREFLKEEGQPQRVSLPSLSGTLEDYSIRSVDKKTLNNMWRGASSSAQITNTLGAALIQRFGFLSLLTSEPMPEENTNDGRRMTEKAKVYLSSISQWISEDTMECAHILETNSYDKKTQAISLRQNRDRKIPIDKPALKWLGNYLASQNL